MKTSEVSVLVVGGGPAGLAASLLLSRYDVPSLLVDRRNDDSGPARARGVHARAMEILRGCGVEAALRRQALPITPGAQWRPTLGGPLLNEDRVGGDDPVETSPCEGLAQSQDVFEAILRREATSRSGAEVRRAVELVSFDLPAGGGVSAVLADRTTGERSAVRARYLVAADGAHSAVRGRLGIPLDGAADLGRFSWLTFRADLSPWTGPHPAGIYFLVASGEVLIWTHPDHRWVLSGPVRSDSVDMADPVARVRAAVGAPDLAVEVLGDRAWTATAQSARRFSDGPVFLVGDAAHRVPPAGATGVSSAIADVHNLAWKLAAVVDGTAGASLLDSYGLEREPVARRNAGELGRVWAALNSGAEGPPFQGRTLQQIDLGYQYASAAVIADGSPDADPPGADYVPSAAPGRRAPHVWVTADGVRRSTVDLVGDGMLLLAGEHGGGWRDAFDEAAAASGVPVRSHLIGEPGWAGVYGVTSQGAVLVRPDGHVAWRAAGAAPTDDARGTAGSVISSVLALGRALAQNA